jgi:hypothetical protein
MWPGSASTQGCVPRWQRRMGGRAACLVGRGGHDATATQLIVGVCCDLVTASGGALAVAIVEAVLVELSSGGALLYIAAHAPVVTAQRPDDRCSCRRVTRSQR